MARRERLARRSPLHVRADTQLQRMIVLASTSPQRRAILDLRIPFRVEAPSYEEIGDDPVDMRSARLAPSTGATRPCTGRRHGRRSTARFSASRLTQARRGRCSTGSPGERTRSSPGSVYGRQWEETQACCHCRNVPRTVAGGDRRVRGRRSGRAGRRIRHPGSRRGTRGTYRGRLSQRRRSPGGAAPRRHARRHGMMHG